MKPIISIIAAIGKNRELGKHVGEDKNSGVGDVLLWDIPEDAKHYRDMTRWHANIMGRKTFESLSEYFHGPPPKRINIVVTRDPGYNPDLIIDKYKEYWKEKGDSPLANIQRTSYTFTDMKEAVEAAKKEEVKLREQRQDGLSPEVFVVGGAQAFKLALPFADRLYLTFVDGEFPDADAFFPEFPEFKKVISTKNSSGNGFNYSFKILKREK